MGKPRAEGIQSAVELALQFEKDGYEFYNDVSKRCKSKIGAEMFEFFAKDELKHIKRIKEYIKGRSKTKTRKDDDEPVKRFRAAFSNAGGEIKKLLTDADEITALKTAMNIESDGRNFYENAEKSADTTEERNLFSFLKDEESQHYKILKNTYDYLNNTAEWLFAGEGPTPDGG